MIVQKKALVFFLSQAWSASCLSICALQVLLGFDLTMYTTLFLMSNRQNQNRLNGNTKLSETLKLVRFLDEMNWVRSMLIFTNVWLIVIIITCPGTSESISHRHIPRLFKHVHIKLSTVRSLGHFMDLFAVWNGRSTTISLSLETSFWIRNSIYVHSAPKFSIPSKFFPSSLTIFKSCVGFGIFEILINILDAEPKYKTKVEWNKCF